MSDEMKHKLNTIWYGNADLHNAGTECEPFAIAGVTAIHRVYQTNDQLWPTYNRDFTGTNHFSNFECGHSYIVELEENTSISIGTANATIPHAIVSDYGSGAQGLLISQVDLAPTPTYALSAQGSVNEGSSFTVTLTTEHVDDGEQVAYSISGIESADISQALSGNFSVSGNSASKTFNVTADNATEGAQTFMLKLTNNLAQVSVTINDTSIKTPTPTPIDVVAPAVCISSSMGTVSRDGINPVTEKVGDMDVTIVHWGTVGIDPSEFVFDGSISKAYKAFTPNGTLVVTMFAGASFAAGGDPVIRWNDLIDSKCYEGSPVWDASANAFMINMVEVDLGNGPTPTLPGKPVVTATSPTTDTTPKWSWSAVSGDPIEYEVEYENNTQATKVSANAALEWEKVAAVAPGSYSLKVRARNADGWGPWSDAKAVVVEAVAPSGECGHPDDNPEYLRPWDIKTAYGDGSMRDPYVQSSAQGDGKVISDRGDETAIMEWQTLKGSTTIAFPLGFPLMKLTPFNGFDPSSYSKCELYFNRLGNHASEFTEAGTTYPSMIDGCMAKAGCVKAFAPVIFEEDIPSGGITTANAQGLMKFMLEKTTVYDIDTTGDGFPDTSKLWLKLGDDCYEGLLHQTSGNGSPNILGADVFITVLKKI